MLQIISHFCGWMFCLFVVFCHRIDRPICCQMPFFSHAVMVMFVFLQCMHSAAAFMDVIWASYRTIACAHAWSDDDDYGMPQMGNGTFTKTAWIGSRERSSAIAAVPTVPHHNERFHSFIPNTNYRSFANKICIIYRQFSQMQKWHWTLWST